MRWFITAALVAFSSSAGVALDCPPGAYPWVGMRGVEYCKRDIYGPQEPAARSVETCPAGTRPATDRRGVRSCKALKSSSRKVDAGNTVFAMRHTFAGGLSRASCQV